MGNEPAISTAAMRRQLAIRSRVEALVRLAAPGLDLVLAVGDRVSRFAGGEEHADPYSIPASGGRPQLGRAPLSRRPSPGPDA